MFQESFSDVLMMLKGHLKDFQGCSKRVSWLSQESFKGVSRKIEDCLEGALRVQRSSKVVLKSLKVFSWMFQGFFKQASRRSILKKFKDRFMEVLNVCQKVLGIF